MQQIQLLELEVAYFKGQSGEKIRDNSTGVKILNRWVETH